MNISSIEASLFKFLYDNFEVPHGIKIFESPYFMDFETYDRWIVIDSLNNSTGPVPKANFFLHLAIKNGLLNDRVVLNDLIDKVTSLVNEGARIDVYDAVTVEPVGEMEIVQTILTPILLHAGGGGFRSLSVIVVYPGEVPS